MKNCNFSVRLVLVVLTFLFSAPSIMAYTFEDGGIYYDIDESGAWVTLKDQSFNSYRGEVNIPATVNYSGRTYTVYGIDYNAFLNCSELTKVTFPNKLKVISSSAFKNCPKLTDLTIPNSVETIGNSAFYDCSGLKEAKIGNGVTEIGEYAFYRCNEMTSISLGDHLQTIHDNAFYGCSQLTSVAFPNSLVTIGNNAFCYCSALSQVVISNGVKVIGDYAFHECMALSNVVIGNSVVYIGTNAFYSCLGLKSVKIPDTVETIGNCAFLHCQGLTDITIGSSVTSLGYGVFAGCTQLRSITCKAVTPPSFVIVESWTTFNNNVYEQGTLYVPKESIGKYGTADIWENFINIKAIVERIPGDVNGDGEVNIADVNAVIDLILGGSGSNASADVNNDGEINIADVNAIIDLILGGGAPQDNHEYVDLGLPSGTLWATCNVGANSPEQYGDYFAWGETAPKEVYTWETYKWCDVTWDSLTKYNFQNYYGTVDNKKELEPADDAAQANWGLSWQMPTKAQQDELHEHCNWQWTTMNGVNGYLCTGPSGKTLFLPAAGYKDGTRIVSEGEFGYYWSHSLFYGMSLYAYNQLFFSGSNPGWDKQERSFGLSIRPVRVAQN